MSNHDDQIKAIASPTRMEILRLLEQPGLNFSHQTSADPARDGVCMILIAERLKMAQPTISRHLEVLRRAGFLFIRRSQKWSYCFRHERNLAEFHAWLGGALKVDRGLSPDEKLGSDGLSLAAGPRTKKPR